MARREFQSTVAEVLPRIIEEQTKNNTGSIKFTHSDKKTMGRVFVKEGKIYAIELNSYTPKIVNRIITNEYISESNREQVIAEYGDRLTDTSVIQFVLKYQFFPEKPLITYLKDYFFDAFDELYQWKDVAAEWRSNEEPGPQVLKVTPIDPVTMLAKLKQREDFLRDVVAQAWSIHPRELDNVRYRRNFKYDDPDYTNMLILELPTDDGAELPIGYVADYLGLPKFNAKLALYNLWKSGAVDIFNPSGIWYSTREQTGPTVLPHLVSSQPQPAAPTPQGNHPNYTPSPVIEETIVEETVAEELTDMISFEQDYGFARTEDNSPDLTPFTLEPLTNEEALPVFSTPPQSQYIKEKEMSTPAAPSAAARLRALKQQLRQELDLLQTSILELHTQRQAKQKYLHSVKSQRSELIRQLKELDKTIAKETSELEEQDKEIARLQAEYNESKDFI